MNDEEFEEMLKKLSEIDAEQFERLVGKLEQVAYEAEENAPTEESSETWGEAAILLRDAKEVIHNRSGN